MLLLFLTLFMATAIHSTWYRNGEDIFFLDEAFQKKAYQITYTYQKYMAKMELEYGDKKAYYEALWRGWTHDVELSPVANTKFFKIPGYRLSISWYYDDGKNNGNATITLPQESRLCSPHL